MKVANGKRKGKRATFLFYLNSNISDQLYFLPVHRLLVQLFV